MAATEDEAKALLDDLDLYRDQRYAGQISENDYHSDEECIWAMIRAADSMRARRRIQRRNRHGGG